MACDGPASAAGAAALLEIGMEWRLFDSNTPTPVTAPTSKNMAARVATPFHTRGGL